jgi:hypothetical protein
MSRFSSSGMLLFCCSELLSGCWRSRLPA